MIAALADWRRFVPAGARRRLRPLRQRVVEWRRSRPPKLGDLRRLTPIDPNWGFERGTPIDRVYVERFVGSHAADIRGRVLEIAAPDYTNAFGRGVEQVDILMATEGNPQATIVGDLTHAPHIPDNSFDCAIVTQTLQFVYDVRSALATLQRILAPEGVLLATMPGLTKISRLEDEQFGEWWHYTGRSVRRLAEEAFGARERRGRDVRQRSRRVGFPLRTRRVRLESPRSSTSTTLCSKSLSGSEPSSAIGLSRRRIASQDPRACGTRGSGGAVRRTRVAARAYRAGVETDDVGFTEHGAPRPHTSPRPRATGPGTREGRASPGLAIRLSAERVSKPRVDD